MLRALEVSWHYVSLIAIVFITIIIIIIIIITIIVIKHHNYWMTGVSPERIGRFHASQPPRYVGEERL